MQRVAGLLLGYSDLLGTTRTYSNPVKWLVEMTAEVLYLRFYQITAQDGPIVALAYSELLGLTLTQIGRAHV